MKSNEYQCTVCGNIYARKWSDEEAMQETQLYWPDVKQKECRIVCEDCWLKMRSEIFLDNLIKHIIAAYGLSPSDLGVVKETDKLNIKSREKHYRDLF